MKALLLAVALLSGALLAGGCVQVSWSRASTEEPITGVMTAPLAPGVATLTDCLARLGAPLDVWETRGGYVLVYAWRDDVGWGLRLSLPIARFASANFRYTDLSRESPSVALFFDPADRLVQLERGQFGQFMQGRLAAVDDDPEDR